MYFLAEYPGARIPLPVEPLYELALVARLIPCSMWTLRHKIKLGELQQRDIFQRPYYRLDSDRRRHRMLTASQVQWLREQLIRRAAKGTWRAARERYRAKKAAQQAVPAS